MDLQRTVLIIAANDAEAILITKLATAICLPMIISHQLHGASLDEGKHDFVKLVCDGKYQTVIVIEMPGVKTETRIKKLNIDLQIIDHHHYTGLDRAHDSKTGKMLSSSLEQFLKMFKLTDARMKKLGFDPLFVKGIGILDRGYVWALQDAGYSKKEIKQVLNFHDKLIEPITNTKTEAQKHKVAYNAWKRRKKWKEFFVIESSADIQLRPRISRFVALEICRSTPLIIIERSRGLIYVQESDYAMKLFETFGGFTFGLDRNWGIHNEKGKKPVTLADVKRVLLEFR